MSDATTRTMLRNYFDSRPAPSFLRQFFQAPQENFFTTEEVEVDIERNGERVSVPVIDGAGARVTVLDKFTNKSWKPPIYREKSPIKALDLTGREPGELPFASIDFQARATMRAMRILRVDIEPALSRAGELQAAQVLQDGVVDLIDDDGVTQYSLDFGMRGTHKITAGTAWSGAADILGDLEAACGVIRDDGLIDPDQVIMGIDAFNAALGNSDFQAAFDNRRIDRGSIVPMAQGGTGGGNYRGTIDVGNYKLDVWTYGGRYDHPQTGVKTQYITPANVIVNASAGRKDAVFGAIPDLRAASDRVLPGLPARFASSSARVGMYAKAYTDESGSTLFVEGAARQLYIPTAIDSFARIATGV